MKGIFAPDLRLMRIKTLVETLEKSKETFTFIKYDKLVLETQMRWGLTEPKAREYVDLAMKNLDAAVDDEGEITWKKTTTL